MTVKLVNISKMIKHRRILNNVSFEFEDRQIYGLVGDQGAGKTMLIRAIAGLLVPSSGKVVIDGQALHDNIDFPPNVGVAFQNTPFLNELTGLQNLVSLSKIQNVASTDDIKKTFKNLGLSEADWNIKLADCSPKLRKKVSIAQAIFEKPKLLLLDEPTAGLDEDSVWNLRNILKALANSGATIILASQDEEALNMLSHVILKIDDGQIIDQVKANWVWG
ncbi:ATP-binding cassette domain-containing protein [Lentilactobacillus raoultii]|uniref:ATP-binding cassette domain-containing protein n=1 Tax=Lentilactobacillus raoultii TaxID=1987503 RepID=A0ABW3PQE7_9LACO|nr:ABC transporter ATP-binding protein [Lentilactobacillus raoultii]